MSAVTGVSRRAGPVGIHASAFASIQRSVPEDPSRNLALQVVAWLLVGRPQKAWGGLHIHTSDRLGPRELPDDDCIRSHEQQRPCPGLSPAPSRSARIVSPLPYPTPARHESPRPASSVGGSGVGPARRSSTNTSLTCRSQPGRWRTRASSSVLCSVSSL